MPSERGSAGKRDLTGIMFGSACSSNSLVMRASGRPRIQKEHRPRELRAWSPLLRNRLRPPRPKPLQTRKPALHPPVLRRSANRHARRETIAHCRLTDPPLRRARSSAQAQSNRREWYCPGYGEFCFGSERALAFALIFGPVFALIFALAQPPEDAQRLSRGVVLSEFSYFAFCARISF